MEAPLVRRAERRDLPRVTEIYNHYVETTPITFDLKPYSVAEREPWFAQFGPSGRHQLFVAERGDRVIGYAGSTSYRPKGAYETSIELTVYVAHDEQTGGVARPMYETLFAALDGEDIHRVLAGITLPNERSVALHERFGFRLIGVFAEVGRKLGRYWDVAWYERRF